MLVEKRTAVIVGWRDFQIPYAIVELYVMNQGLVERKKSKKRTKW